jgi:hypothetical protein
MEWGKGKEKKNLCATGEVGKSQSYLEDEPRFHLG